MGMIRRLEGSPFGVVWVVLCGAPKLKKTAWVLGFRASGLGLGA